MAKDTTPEITGSYFKGLREDSGVNVATGDLDVRNGPDLFTPVELSGMFGTLSLTEAGQWTYVLDNSRDATQALDQGERKADWFFVSTADGSATHIVYVTVHGTRDDAPAAATAQLVGIQNHHWDGV